MSGSDRDTWVTCSLLAATLSPCLPLLVLQVPAPRPCLRMTMVCLFSLCGLGPSSYCITGWALWEADCEREFITEGVYLECPQDRHLRGERGGCRSWQREKLGCETVLKMSPADFMGNSRSGIVRGPGL